VPENTKVVSINSEDNQITIDNVLESPDEEEAFAIQVGKILLGEIVISDLVPETTSGAAGVDSTVYQNSSVSGVIKNIFVDNYTEENFSQSGYPATVQSSALVFKGNVVNSIADVKNFVSYIYKPLDNKFRHFGTRVRIIGKIENNEGRGQTPEGSSIYYVTENTENGQSATVAGGSGGLAVMINPETNTGYYFEIAALTENNFDQYSVRQPGREELVRNVLFYKVARNSAAESDSDKAIPIKLFDGIAEIIVDSGNFVGQSRLAAEEASTVYDLAVEYEDVDGIRKFYLYINNTLIGIAEDEAPLPIVNNMALFVRGNAKLMFENVYALT
jgi:hypothetical protein